MVMALDGIKVLDLSRLAPGPYCSMLLADFGADVTLVEPIPGAQAKFETQAGIEAERRAASGRALGRGKRSIALNLKDLDARAVFHELAKSADVVLEGFRPGVVKRLGVDYETLAAINPRIICCSISGFGQDGPYSQVVGHDLNYIALAGALGVTGWPGQPPAIPVNLLADFAGGGLMAAFAICLAIIARERTGRGQNIDIAMSDGVLSLMTSAFASYIGTGRPIRAGEFSLNGAAPYYCVYPTADGRWYSIGCVEPHFYENLCDLLGLAELKGRQEEIEQWPAFKERIAAVMRTKTVAEWQAVFHGQEICAEPVLAMEEVLENEHNLARSMVTEAASPTGPVRQIGIGPKLSDTPGRVTTVAPATGQHTDGVLAGLGLSAERIAELRARGAIA
jgi:crotonobetainyl-CoA:carnitine CoA-transferase CaiB-like acyl-CoA transferase